jgi:hypothetical protein
MTRARLGIAALCALATGLAAATQTCGVSARAFPGAEGFGAGTPGGRRGAVIAVTTLLDCMDAVCTPTPGSLRAALETPGPRIVVFRVSGRITVNKPLVIRHPYVTIAGQTSPGGIQVRRAPSTCLTFSDSCPTLLIRTHDVVVRYLRLRPGRATASSQDDALTIASGSGEEARDIVIDHCSLGWATDELLDVGGDAHARDVTVQWSILAEGLGLPMDPSPSKGVLVGSAIADSGTGRVSLHHNLLAHNWERNPLVATDFVVDFVNNVIHNAAGAAAGIQSDERPLLFRSDLNYEANAVQRRSGAAGTPIELAQTVKDDPPGTGVSTWVAGNIGPNRTSPSYPEAAVLGCQLSSGGSCAPRLAGRRFDAPAVSTTWPSGSDPAAPLRALVLDGIGAGGPNLGVGASARVDATGTLVPARDASDACLVDTVVRRTVQPGETVGASGPGTHDGDGIIGDPSGGCGPWPALVGGLAPSDSDGDGMPDAFEQRFGFAPLLGVDGALDADLDGYTNVEEYLNGTDPHRGQ